MTEQTAVANCDLTKHVTRQLQDLGVRISIDDFGTGYSSFRHLQAVPIDAIKIDRSFLKEKGSKLDWGIVDAVIKIADATGMQVIAEGIENETQLKILKKHGRDFGQGFFFSEAVSSENALQMLKNQTTISF